MRNIEILRKRAELERLEESRQKAATLEDAIDILSKLFKYNGKAPIAPNGKPYEQNDIDYLVDKCGYDLDAAIAELSMADKYIKR